MEQELLLYTLEKIYNREPLGIGYPLQSNISASGLRDDPEMIFSPFIWYACFRSGTVGVGDLIPCLSEYSGTIVIRYYINDSSARVIP